MEYVVSDDHPGLKKVVESLLLRNGLDYLPRKAAETCLKELRWIYEQQDVQAARQSLALWIKKW